MTNDLIFLEKVEKKFFIRRGKNFNLIQFLKSLLSGKRCSVLENINLKVRKGECVGIVGKKDSGKSTLLKIMGGIILPTSGKVKVNGKVFPLIDSCLHAMHPELTGRENLYFYGSLAGVSKSKISAKLEEILDFSQLRDVIDYKVKSFSFDKKIKLILSLALFLDHEILFLDGFLPIHDKQFAKKVASQINYLKNRGVTIIVTSESIEITKDLCERCILMKNGRFVYNGPSEELALNIKELKPLQIVS